MKIILLLITLLYNLLALDINFTEKEKQYLKEKKQITMCIDPDWMPFEKIENGKHIGLSSEYIKIVQKTINIPIKLIETKSWNNSIEKAKNRECDIFSMVPIIEKRKKYMDFTSPYLDIPMVIVTKSDKNFIDNIKQIIPKKIGVVIGYSIANILKERYKDINIVDVISLNDGLKKVESGEIYAFIDNLATLNYEIQKNFMETIKVSGRLDTRLKYRVATRNDEPILHNIFEKVITKIDTNTKDQIFHKWINPPKKETITDYTLIWQILSVVFIILISFTYRQYILNKSNKYLKKSVEEKTKDLKKLNDNLENKVAEKTSELREEKEHIELIIESNNNAIIALNYWGVITTYNKKAQEIFGWSKEEMIDSKNIMNIIPPKYKKQHIKAMQNYLETGIFKNKFTDVHQLEGINRAGDIFPIRVSIGSIFRGEETIIIANIADVSREKHQEKLLNQQSKMVAMGEMIGNIAHQWRQPLSIISMSSNNMLLDIELDELNSENIKEYASDINRQTKYLSQTIDDFKNFIRGDREKVIFNIDEFINSFLTLVQGSIKNNNINVIFNLDRDTKVYGYKNELTQCIINIYNNAKDALNEKVETDRMIFISAAQENNRVVIKIKDNAGGIADDILPKIFEPYFTTKHKSQGTGLGLHMTYMLIVEGMDGVLDVSNQTYIYENKKYSGAEFIISLPMND